MKKNNILNGSTIELNNKQTRILLVFIIILVIILLFRKILTSIIENIIVFSILFLLFLIISKNILITFIGSCIVFLLLKLIMNYRNTIEKFENLDPITKPALDTEPPFDSSIFNTPDLKNASENIQELLKKMNGGIKLNDTDLQETDKLGIDVKKYEDDKTPNTLKQAQKETYELINTVNALKDTITTLAPVLQEGKKLMNIFENLKM